MNAERSARWVRRWVRLYTNGLPDDIRRDRVEEIDSDLWDQLADAGTESSDGAIGTDLFARFVLGIPADLRWRMDQPSGASAPTKPVASPSLLGRNVAILAAVGGVAWAVWVIPAIAFGEDAWVGSLGFVTVISLVIGSLCLSAATGALVFGNVDRLRGIASALGAVGMVAGMLIAVGVYWGLVALPLGSAAVMRGLASLGIVNSRLGWIHASSSVLVTILILPLLTNVVPPASASGAHYALLAGALELYALSWLAIAWSMRTGTWLPQTLETNA